ncbi:MULTISPECIES: maleylpyruvate isomerase family mycothiol-dependent enzyme [unclassified Streptomyces]|uniref:maleylpyruvate isomerase family mycothiol-dependent enzyme n=1 Tax=unclassified Streptomyces TaxID=2593676 RepID=UPI00224ED9E5|nr:MULTISPECIES: maleylpyruvate isomerase family mycothiol-dependent enzyme [unclassified Streptomyces]MCX5049626.1 maleylpyruvate isomerase family mycothiol-dependent enzyme [Streptomyces sp. NBC_00474]MCX5055646.1 maleylpyruvate isomerase family mycothiol-dependent enzyme [Streptomyces sp. NBC_00452]MCX5247508.1 maleylpyruvate isomerase family mycothiol-dependent enzyme [Streptomyces sp. NBC_00201]MCX5286711.1 maleylpyruvate isomerase family mycothiol-dependent enzyme [Streptomyces sp. NBC_00
MSLHPTLQPYADAWTHSIEAISELVGPLVEGEWNRRTPCPGWSVRDVVSHVMGLDCEMLGDPRPIHTLPRDLFHVTNDSQRYMEMQVDVRRHHTAPEMTSELEYVIIRRNRQLRNESRDPGTKVRGPLGTELGLEESMRAHAFNVWVHEQDLRAALGRPGNLDSPGAHIARDVLLAELPRIVAEDASAPRSSAVVFDVHGPIEFLRTIRVDIQGRGTLETAPALGPAATLTLDWETYVRLACGRVTPAAVADRVKAEGDPELTGAILRNFTVTP